MTTRAMSLSRGMIRCATTPPSSPVPWRPQCSSASPLASELARRSGALAPALATRARRPRSRVPAVRVCRAFRCTPIPRSPPIGATSWNACSAIPLPVELVEKLAALVPLPRVHLMRYGGCLALHSYLRGAIIPTPRQQGVDEEATDTGSPRWSWARLLKRVFALDMARCPWSQRGVLRIIAAITHGEVIRMILRHLKCAVDPPPIAPARVHQAACA